MSAYWTKLVDKIGVIACFQLFAPFTLEMIKVGANRLNMRVSKLMCRIVQTV